MLFDSVCESDGEMVTVGEKVAELSVEDVDEETLIVDVGDVENVGCDPELLDVAVGSVGVVVCGSVAVGDDDLVHE